MNEQAMNNNSTLDSLSSLFMRARRRSKWLRDDKGATLVEYAIVFLVFMTMLLGIADFGRALYAFHFVSSAAREGARYAMVRGCSTTSSLCPTAATASSVQTFVKNVPLGIDPTKVTVATTWPTSSYTPPICTSTKNAPGCLVQVQVTYTFNFVFPLVSKTPLTMKSTSQMVIVQ